MVRILSKFARDKGGVAAIEFAILAPAFFALMSAIFEITFFIYANTSAQRAVEDVIYEMRTGYIHSQIRDAGKPLPEQYLKNEICKNASIPNCLDTIKISMEKYDGNYNTYDRSDDSGVIDAGTRGTLMRLEAQIQIPNVVFGSAIFGKENMAVTAGLTFMTEPY
ncbi:TadE/TadG family type IV pilus assembly protein [Ahrensia kielensis]|uniref:TadE/TadG family type IV pilus assembly protein n=1 Tax=Ahrensia kielensis TaxID=76980 RepID=UPI000A044DE5|nr:TadE/TadG family type IV pilus assembly protein [Ahrensia kielensis]